MKFCEDYHIDSFLCLIFADIAYNPETMSAYTSPITYQLSLDRYVGHDEWGLDKYIVIIVVLIDEQASVYGLNRLDKHTVITMWNV